MVHFTHIWPITKCPRFDIKLHPSPQCYDVAATWVTQLDSSHLSTNGLVLSIVAWWMALSLLEQWQGILLRTETAESQMLSRSELGKKYDGNLSQ